MVKWKWKKSYVFKLTFDVNGKCKIKFRRFHHKRENIKLKWKDLKIKWEESKGNWEPFILFSEKLTIAFEIKKNKDK